MAFMSQERKAVIHAELKRVIPKSWKWSLAVRHHSTIVLTITAAPEDLLGQMKAAGAEKALLHNRQNYIENSTHADVNPYYYRESGLDVETFDAIFAALNRGNHDRSEPQSDYFDVGWYVGVNIGRWDRPFACTAPSLQVAA